MEPLEHMARIKTDGIAGPLPPLVRLAGTAGVVLGGIAIAAAFFAPGLALAGGMPAGATGAHPWIVDGGGEIANNVHGRIEIMLEYIALGLVAMIAALRFGRVLLAKAQDWYEGAPLMPPKRAPHPVPATMFPRARAADAANAANADETAGAERRELHAA